MQNIAQSFHRRPIRVNGINHYLAQSSSNHQLPHVPSTKPCIFGPCTKCTSFPLHRRRRHACSPIPPAPMSIATRIHVSTSTQTNLPFPIDLRTHARPSVRAPENLFPGSTAAAAATAATAAYIHCIYGVHLLWAERDAETLRPPWSSVCVGVGMANSIYCAVAASSAATGCVDRRRLCVRVRMVRARWR